jgi:tetratricopeptide (TPR) repeat protein
MRSRAALAAGVLLVAAGPAFAQLDSEPKTPCLWRVVLKVQPHPLLSASFRDHVKHDVVAALQPAIGQLGTVEVLELPELLKTVSNDQRDSLWQQFDDKGFAALDGSRDLTGAKTHFLTIAYRDGQYHLESRQYDGFAGLASPLVRKQSVRAPELVGRIAGLMLNRDFGLTGSFDPMPGNVESVRVSLRGGQLGGIDRLVKIGDIFSVSAVSKTDRPAPPPIRTATGKIIAAPPGSVPPPALKAEPRKFTLLRVTEVGNDGTVKCGVLTLYQNVFAGGRNTVGYRCMKLGTVEGPLTVRLVTQNPENQKSTGAATVRATENGFKAPKETRDLLKFKDGLFRSDRALAHVACVTVEHGNRSVPFPVPVLSADPVNLPFEINDDLQRKAENLRSLLAAVSHVTDARNAQTICFEATAKLIEKKKNSDALARAKDGFKSADEADKSIVDDLTKLKEAPDLPAEAPRLIASIERQLAALRQFNTQLSAHIKMLEKVVARENDPTAIAEEVQAEALTTRITLLLSRGDVEEAINAYDQLVTLLPNSPEVKARRDKLKADWAPKNDAHSKARDYLLKKWAAIATIPDYKESLPELGRAIDECKKNGDKHTLRKMLTLFTAAGAKLNDLVAPLDPNADADRKLATDAKAVITALGTHETAITEFVDAK